MAMLGVIVSGRLVQTDFQQISETQFLTTILDADNINHIVIFLTGIQPLPEGTAGQETWASCIEQVTKEEDELFHLDNTVENMKLQFTVNTDHIDSSYDEQSFID